MARFSCVIYFSTNILRLTAQGKQYCLLSRAPLTGNDAIPKLNLSLHYKLPLHIHVARMHKKNGDEQKIHRRFFCEVSGLPEEGIQSGKDNSDYNSADGKTPVGFKHIYIHL